MSAVVALRLTFFLSGKDFLSCAELLQESLGLLALLFLTPHTLTAAPPLHLMSFLILDTSLCSNFTLCRKLYSLLKSSSVMPRHDSMHARICLLLPERWDEGVDKACPPPPNLLLTPPCKASQSLQGNMKPSTHIP